jgi:cell division protein FtsL
MHLPILVAQASAVDMSTPFTLAVVVLLVGVAAAFGAMQMQTSTMKENITRLDQRVSEREKHGGDVDTRLASMSTTLSRVDANVEKLLTGAQHQRSSA